MIQLEISKDEAVILKDYIESCLSDLRMEIAGTESMDFRERLKKKEAFLKRLLEQLSEELK
ncbi:MAG: hypothetical protein P8184_05660 [Calditrichia bacterium]